VIDKTVAFDMNVADGGNSNDPVTIASDEKETIVVTKNAEAYDYKAGEAVPLLAQRGVTNGKRRHADESVRRKQHTRTSGGIGIRGGFSIRCRKLWHQLCSRRL
jgi:hypothetical protein